MPLFVPLALQSGRGVGDVGSLIGEVGIGTALILGSGAIVQVVKPLPVSVSNSKHRMIKISNQSMRLLFKRLVIYGSKS